LEISVSEQAIVFLNSLCFGVALGVIYDLFRIIRVAFPMGKIIVFIEDLLFLISAGLFSFIFILTVNSGRIRIFLLIAAAIGFILYYFTIGKLILKSAQSIIKIIKFILSKILSPFAKICSIIQRKIKKIFKKLKRVQLFFKKYFKFIKKKIIINKKECKNKKVCGEYNGKKKTKYSNINGTVFHSGSPIDYYNGRFR